MRYYIIKNWMKIILVLGFIAAALSISVYLYTSKYEPTNPSDGLISVTVKGADMLFDNGLLAESLDMYHQIQKFISPKTQLDIYGYVKIKEGMCYAKYAEKSDKEKNILKAIASYKEAIKLCSIDKFPAYYAMAQQYLGDSYDLYSVFNDEQANLNNALQSYDESLKVYTIESNPQEHGLISFKKGTICLALSKYNNENLSKSLESYKDALKTFQLETNPFEYALIHARIGTVYLELAMGTPTKENFEESIKSYQKSLKVNALKEHTAEHVIVVNNLASAYYSIAQIDNPETHLKSAISHISTALNNFTTSSTFHEREKLYATLHANLGAVYHRLSYFCDTIRNLRKSIQAYQAALSEYNRNDYPDEYKAIQRGIGTAYSEIANIIPSMKNLKKANIAYDEVMKASTYKPFPLLITTFDRYNRNPLKEYVNLNDNEDKKNIKSDIFKLNSMETRAQGLINKVENSNIPAVERIEDIETDITLLIAKTDSANETSTSVELKKKNQITNRRIHIVRSGENTYRIALRYGLTLDELCALNNMMSKDIVRPGQKLIVQ